MKLKITKTFNFAHRGCDVVTYTKGDVVDATDKALIDVAMEEGWATKAGKNDALSAPEDKDGKQQLETKDAGNTDDETK